MNPQPRLTSTPAEPFVPQDSVQILLGPPSLEPDILYEVPFPTHTHPLEQRHGRRVPAISYGDDPVQPQDAERVIQHARDGFGGEPSTLMLPRQREPDLGPVGFVLVDPQGAVPY